MARYKKITEKKRRSIDPTKLKWTPARVHCIATAVCLVRGGRVQEEEEEEEEREGDLFHLLL